MFHTPDHYHNISMRLSDVLGDIGVNEKMLLKMRRTAVLDETNRTIIFRGRKHQMTSYNFGSWSEGTTTLGLRSDTDHLFTKDDINVIQDWSEWTLGKRNYLMIQNETIPPGYSLLQKLRNDVPLPDTHEYDNHFAKDTSGRILFKNTIVDKFLQVATGRHQRQGPSIALTQQPGVLDEDLVSALPCTSWPQSAKACLSHLDVNNWPTANMYRYIKTTKCFVVGVGNKVSENADFEWRLSTSLAERSLMFNLNITQIRCYILMKMIIKTYINPDNESYISSFMCKTVLFHCIASKPSYIWKECNILNCLTYCILTLNRCISCRNCPHFFDCENNLMAGKFSNTVKQVLLQTTAKLIPCDGMSLFGIQFDNVGERLQIKLNIMNGVHHNIPSPDEYTRFTSATLLGNTTGSILDIHNGVIQEIKDKSLVKKLRILLQIVQHLTRYYRDGDILVKVSSRLLAPIYCSSIGSLIASHNIQINNTVSPQALVWLETGLDSDVASSRLKLASILYCTGQMKSAAFILNDVYQRYNTEVTEPQCGCYLFPATSNKIRFGQISSQYDEEAVKYIAAYCVTFCREEINCVPHELQYEMFRSTQEDIQHRDILDDGWMDCAVVDSLPYLYFLQYKTLGNLNRPEEQQQALTKLIWATKTENNLGHRETALNLLGQCMEQENRLDDALQCYMLSLHVRETNNAAKIHICRCLANTHL
ncbi:uncharacterized protein LOC123566494 [Mercenaria mercenaria]|uniref:uncharacterized protein LOC123566494 n=1 Tax=Mercenaria mercenaria TaxID=6596 RepID=UPI00234F25A6|nr:uncharacterized protein LOC123566494 [Mercenaria mercenaria]XP_045216590.2 uncharacterized protein LOC123566494 [Mercenaria mercenaria]